MHCAEREGVRVCEAHDPRIHALNQRNSLINLAERPQHECEIGHGGHAKVHPEAKRQIVVAPGLEQGESTFEMLPRFAVLSGEQMRGSGRAMSGSGLWPIRLRLDVG